MNPGLVHNKSLHEGDTDRYQYRGVWISDAHIGSSECSIDKLILFLGNIRCEYLYLVGDIFDLWRLGRRSVLGEKEKECLRLLKFHFDGGTKIYYVLGNHDRRLVSNSIYIDYLSWISPVRECEHIAVDGSRFLVIHGDQIEPRFVRSSSKPYFALLRWINRAYQYGRVLCGLKKKCALARLKARSRSVFSRSNDFVGAARTYAKSRGYRGIVCGHIHDPLIEFSERPVYLNCGDWVVNCTALIERVDGSFYLQRY